MKYNKINKNKFCKCGCGQLTKFSYIKKGCNDYINGHNHPKHTKGFKKRLSKRQKGENNISKKPEVKEKQRLAKLKNPTKFWLNKKRSFKVKEVLRLKNKGNKYRLGKKHKQETKDKLSILKSKQTSELIASGKLFNGNSKYRGDFWSKKNSRFIYYQSFYEKRCLEIFEKNPNILKFNRCKIILIYQKNGKSKRYIPDFEVVYINNIKKIIEVKPLKLIPYNLEKINVLRDYCLQNNISFEIYTEKELEIDRDYNSSLEIKRLMLIQIGQELSESTPMEMEALPMVTSVVEVGSLLPK